MEVVLVLLLLIIVVIAVWAIAMYNRLVRLRNLVQEAWRQIDVELHRRYDLIPNLVETVKGYAAHERGVFEEVTQARARAATPGASPGEQARHEDLLSNALGRLFAVAENYPQLRSAENFAQLQQELTNTEDRIAAGRRFYNANVRSLNTKTEVFPSNIVAAMFNFARAGYFEANNPEMRARPNVSFSDAQGNPGTSGQGRRPAPGQEGSQGQQATPGQEGSQGHPPAL